MNERSSASLEALLNANKPPVAEVPPTEEVKVETVAPEKVSQPTEVPSPRKVDEPTVVESWDNTKVEPHTEPVIDEPAYLKIAKKVGIDVKDEDELVAKFKADPYEGLPVNLKKAIEFAKKGGDYLKLLKVSDVDYNAFDPVQLYETDVLSKAPDKAAAQEWLQTLSPIQKHVEGSRLKQQLISQQQFQEIELQRSLEYAQAQAQAERDQAVGELTKAIESLDTIQVSDFKLKLDSRHKKALANSIAGQEFWKDKKYQTAKGYDIHRKIRDEFITSNWDTVQSFLADRVRANTLKTVIEEVQNPQLEPTTGRDQVDQKNTPLFEQLTRQLRDKKVST
jgi:hypothetical protein